MGCKNCTSNGCQCVVIGDGIVTVTGAGDLLSPYVVEIDPCTWVQDLSSGTFVSGSTPVLIDTGGGCAMATITIPSAEDVCDQLNDLELGTYTPATTLIPAINGGVCELVTINPGLWSSYSPTFSGLTVGSGVVSGSYTRIGDTIHFTASFTFGAGSAVAGPITVTVPVTIGTAGQNNHSLFSATLFDSAPTPNYHPATCFYASTTTVGIRATNAGGTYTVGTALSSTIPITWATGDTITVSGTYPA